jgi:hypothetical protein
LALGVLKFLALQVYKVLTPYFLPLPLQVVVMVQEEQQVAAEVRVVLAVTMLR